jgi:CRP-like cAMP-binding protein
VNAPRADRVDERVLAERARALRRSPLFAELGRREMAALVRLLGERHVPRGAVVIRQGEVGAGFFVLASGMVDVLVDDRYVHSLGPGDHFGDVALVVESPRTATVVAATPVVCLTLASWEFRRLVESDAAIAWQVLTSMARRLLGERDALARPPGRRRG